MAVYDSDKKLILTRILKTMILLFVLFLLYVLFSSASNPIKDIKTATIKTSQLYGVNLSLILVKGIPVAVFKNDNKWLFINAVNKHSGCVIKVKKLDNKKQWYDVCSKRSYQLNGQANGEYSNLIIIKSKAIETGFRLYFEN